MAWGRKGIPKAVGLKTGGLNQSVPNAQGPQPIKAPSFGEPKSHAAFLSLGAPKAGIKY